jgi:very-short-patch-repair endonuclease
MTHAEVRLWTRLRSLRAEGFHFRRQAPFKGYFLDFVCFSRRLVVELDGAHHGSDVQADHDWLRDRILAREGFEVMRFWNTSLDVDLEGVVD